MKNPKTMVKIIAVLLVIAMLIPFVLQFFN